MGCENALSFKIEINIENELGVFEPRDEVAGHVVIKTEEDTEIDSCILWLYGIAKTRWNTQSESYISRPGSLASGINLSRSTSNFNRFDNISSCIVGNKFCKLLSNASEVIKHGNSSKFYENSLFPTQLNCCTDQGYLSDTHHRPNCNCNHLSYPLNHHLICETRIGESWISTSGSFNSSLDTENSIKSNHSFEKFHSPSMIITTNNKTNSNFTDYPLKTFQPISTTDKVYDSTCLPNFCLEQWKKLFEIDEQKKKCIYHGDIQLIYKSKNDLLKHYNKILSDKTIEKIEHITINNTTETLKCDTDDDNNVNNNNNNNTNLNQIHNINEINSQQYNLKDQINKNTLSNNINKKYHDLLNTTNEKLQTSLNKSNKIKSKFILTRGIHVFYFEFQLPSDLPSSFELPTNCLAGGASASITYAVRIEICNNRLKLRHVQQREIIVFRPLELIHFPRLRDRITLHREFVSIGCCSHPSGLILCDLAVNKTGFVPGETIIPQVHITNKSSRAIQTVHLTFAQTVFLKGINDQSHVEVLRIFATRLNARSTLSGFDLFERLEVNRISSLFSPSNSFSSRSSTNRFERIHQHQQKQQNSMHNKSDKRVMSNLKQKHHQAHHHSSSTNVVAVASQGGKAYFTDLIHVPPLPTSGLLGRQRLIYVEYSLILRLRMQGDKEGKHDHCMQIPIIIGSDPTRETSFTGNSEVIPCYASFNFASGDIVEHDPLNQFKSKRLTPVYRYFKSKPIESTANKSNITFSSDSPVNSNSVKSLQIISTSSPSILKQSSIINNSTSVTTHKTEDTHQNSFKSIKSTCPDKEQFQQRQSTKHVNKSIASLDKPFDTTTISIPTLLHNLNETKTNDSSYRKVQPRKCKSVSTNKLKRQSNFQETTPQKVITSNSVDVITVMNDSSQLCLSNQQYFDDGNITLCDTPTVTDNKINSLKSLQRSKQSKSDSFNSSRYEKAQYPTSYCHLKYSAKNGKIYFVPDTLTPPQRHSSTSPYLETSKLEYKCKSQTNIPIHQYSVELLSDQPSFSSTSFDDSEQVRSSQQQLYNRSYCYNPDIVQTNQILYTVINDGEEDEEDESNEDSEEGNDDEEDYIPSGSNNDEITSDEIRSKLTIKTTRSQTFPCNNNLKHCIDNSAIKQTESSSSSVNNDEEYNEENDNQNYPDDEIIDDIHKDDDETNDGIEDNKDFVRINDNNEATTRQCAKPLKPAQDEDSSSQNNSNNTQSDTTDLYYKVQKISKQKNISLNYKLKQTKDLYNAYWNCPKVEPILNRKSNTDGYWTYGHGSTNHNNNENNL
ncbi:hypothetical protein MN116_000789 [Schistosoma mekongi]|uniref:Arrestin C-terminal-like domain-containing protein n=1 Tax=Schistosoma mekongi TaxID=38744 RepID=A0AAE1ZL07_SCHME|nr:hypothetical protein MN116_000789 [Schistosoma mekongi]